MTALANQPETAPARVVFFASAEPLIRALTNGLLFAGTDDTLPMLACIRFEFDGSTLTAASTDRYRLCLEEVELDRKIDHNGQPSFEFMLPRAAAKQALAALKANKPWPLALALVDLDSASPGVEFRFVEQTVRYTPYDGQFPDYRTLIPDADGTVKVDRMIFTPAFLADLGKVVTGQGRGKGALTIKLYGVGKITRVDYADGPMVLLMSQRGE